MAAPRKVDYDRIEPGWRAGIKSPAQLAAEYTAETKVSVSHAAIIKHFKKLGVPRDLSAKVRAKADAMVMESMVTSKVAPITKARESEIVAEVAGQQVHVRLSHRKDIATARALCVTLLAELNTVTGEQLTIELLADLRERLENPEPSEATTKALDKARDALSKAMSLPSRAGSLKALADSLKTLVGLEREAWGLEADKTPNPPDSNNEDSRDRNLRSIEALSARLASPAPGAVAAASAGAADPEPVA